MRQLESRALGFEPLETRAMLAGTALEQGLAGLRQIATESRVAHQQVDTALQAAAGRVVDTMISLSQIGQQNAQELARASANVGQISSITNSLTTQYRGDILDLLRTGQANKIGERSQRLAQDIQSATASATSGLQKEQQDQVEIAAQTALASATTADNARAAADAHQQINSDAVSALLDIARRIREATQSGNMNGNIGVQAIVDEAKQDFQQDVSELNGRLAENDAQLAVAEATAQSRVGSAPSAPTETANFGGGLSVSSGRNDGHFTTADVAVKITVTGNQLKGVLAKGVGTHLNSALVPFYLNDVFKQDETATITRVDIDATINPNAQPGDFNVTGTMTLQRDKTTSEQAAGGGSVFGIRATWDGNKLKGILLRGSDQAGDFEFNRL
jgi:hypothetical protein